MAGLTGVEPAPYRVTGGYLNRLTSIPNNTLLSAEASHYVGCSGPNVGVVNGANRQTRTVVSGLEDQSTNHCAIFACVEDDGFEPPTICM